MNKKEYFIKLNTMIMETLHSDDFANAYNSKDPKVLKVIKRLLWTMRMKEGKTKDVSNLVNALLAKFDIKDLERKIIKQK